MYTHEILSFWFKDHGPEDWFKKDDNFDQAITKQFLKTYEDHKKKTVNEIFKAAENHDDNRDHQAEFILAHIILFDQFPRNMFRNTPKAFESDPLALKLVHKMIDTQHDLALDTQKRVFAYMPYMHSEDLQDQQTSVALYEGLKGASENAKFARAHLKVIEDFGRFPHRNKILGRKSSPEEQEYLKTPGAGF